MDDGAYDGGVLDLTAVSRRDLADLGDSALGHALRRALAMSHGDPDNSDTIAAHDSHV
jgi:hypothetical protein